MFSQINYGKTCCVFCVGLITIKSTPFGNFGILIPIMPTMPIAKPTRTNQYTVVSCVITGECCYLNSDCWIPRSNKSKAPAGRQESQLLGIFLILGVIFEMVVLMDKKVKKGRTEEFNFKCFLSRMWSSITSFFLKVSQLLHLCMHVRLFLSECMNVLCTVYTACVYICVYGNV